jgi:hypothetical protein
MSGPASPELVEAEVISRLISNVISGVVLITIAVVMVLGFYASRREHRERMKALLDEDD